MTDTQIYQTLLDSKQRGEAVVLATIIRDQGSVPRHTGAKMIIFDDGKIMGTIGGGTMESRVIEHAPIILESGKPEIMSYSLVDPERGDPGVCGGQVEIFMEPILPDPTVLVIGCGHIGQAVADLAHWLGFRVIVSDDRAELCHPDAIPNADEYIVAASEELLDKVTIHRRTYVIAVTRGVIYDLPLIPGLLESPAPYIGVIGSKRRWLKAVKQLKEKGIEEQTLKRIHSPIGLEIGAETPREIALSIMVEVVMLAQGGTGKSMKMKTDSKQTVTPS